jgi:hypothetical protein
LKTIGKPYIEGFTIRDNKALDIDLVCEDGNEYDIPIQDPKRIRGKGRERGERLKGHFEKHKRGSSLRGSHSQGLHFYFVEI